MCSSLVLVVAAVDAFADVETAAAVVVAKVVVVESVAVFGVWQCSKDEKVLRTSCVRKSQRAENRKE